MELREALPLDIEALISLKRPRLELHRQIFAEIQRKRFLAVNEGEAIYLVAYDGAVVGHVYLQLRGTQTAREYPDINDLYVQDDKRGQGIGTQLIRECERIAEERGFQGIGLSVNPTLNLKAKALYERLGYVDVGRPPYLSGVYDGDEDWVIDLFKPF